MGGATPIRVRAATSADVDRCISLRTSSIAAYRAELGLDYRGRDPSAGPRVLAHIVGTDPEGVLLAEDEDTGSILGYVASTRRGGRWCLGSLYVVPEAQGAGLGRTLLKAVLPVDAGVLRMTFTDVLQPTSNAMYARLGMTPRVPLFRVEGVPSADAVLASDEVAEFDQSTLVLVGDIDLTVKGCRSDEDHAFMMSEAEHVLLFRGKDGRAAGYGYVHADGRLGPVAVLNPGDLLAAVASLARFVPEGRVSMWVAGTADALLVWALGSGLRIVGFPALACWDEPVVDFARYVPWSLTLP